MSGHGDIDAVEALRRMVAGSPVEELPVLVGAIVEMEETARLRLRSEAVPPGADEVQLLTMPEVAERLQIHEETVREMGRRGELPTVQVGRQVRVPLSGLKDWVESQERGSWRS